MAYNNGNKFDKDAHYAAMSTKKLEELIVFWKAAVIKHEKSKGVASTVANELAIVQMKLAERIGKK